MNDCGEEEIGDGFEFSCWTAVSSGLKLSSSGGSCGGKSKPCAALAMRWHDWNEMKNKVKSVNEHALFACDAYENKFFHVEESILIDIAEIPNFCQDIDG